MAVEIHPLAVVDKRANLGENVRIGPFAVVAADTNIGDDCEIGSHAVIDSYTTLGKNGKVYAGAIIGSIPQDLKFRGEKTTLTIGDNAIIREYCTINRGTIAAGQTKIGNNCVLLSYCHVGHDCILGDDFLSSNSLALAGHVETGKHVGCGGLVAVHQFCRIGDHAYLGGTCGISKDIIPFAIVGMENGEPKIAGINKIGLERKGFDQERRFRIKRAYRTLFMGDLTVAQAVEKLSIDYPADPDIQLIVDFIKNSKRGIHRMNVSTYRDDD